MECFFNRVVHWCEDNRVKQHRTQHRIDNCSTPSYPEQLLLPATHRVLRQLQQYRCQACLSKPPPGFLFDSQKLLFFLLLSSVHLLSNKVAQLFFPFFSFLFHLHLHLHFHLLRRTVLEPSVWLCWKSWRRTTEQQSIRTRSSSSRQSCFSLAFLQQYSRPWLYTKGSKGNEHSSLPKQVQLDCSCVSCIIWSSW